MVFLYEYFWAHRDKIIKWEVIKYIVHGKLLNGKLLSWEVIKYMIIIHFIYGCLTDNLSVEYIK